MRNKTLPRVIQVLGFIAAMASFSAVHAVQITMTLPDCPTGQALAFNSATNALSCGTGGGPVVQQPIPSSCSIATSPTSDAGNGITAGTQVLLTALCTAGTAPITYSWNIGVIGPSLTVAPSQTTQYVVTPSNSVGTGATFSTTVYVGTTQPTPGATAPSGCSISQSPNSAATAVQPNTTVTLSMTCGGGSPVTGCAWSNGIAGTACAVNVSAPTATTSYSATASNSAGTSSASTTISVTSAPISNAQNYCTGNDQIIPVAWPADGQVKPRTNGFGNQRLAFKITIPTVFNPGLNINHLGFLRIAEVPGGAVVTRDYTISYNSCDFQSSSYIYNGLGLADTAPYLSFAVNNPLGYLASGATLNFKGGDIIYFNIRNYFSSTPTCPYSSCDISLDFATPNRY